MMISLQGVTLNLGGRLNNCPQASRLEARCKERVQKGIADIINSKGVKVTGIECYHFDNGKVKFQKYG